MQFFQVSLLVLIQVPSHFFIADLIVCYHGLETAGIGVPKAQDKRRLRSLKKRKTGSVFRLGQKLIHPLFQGQHLPADYLFCGLLRVGSHNNPKAVAACLFFQGQEILFYFFLPDRVRYLSRKSDLRLSKRYYRVFPGKVQIAAEYGILCLYGISAYLDNYLIALSQRPALLCPCGSQRAGESMLPVLRETVVSCFSSSEIDKSGIYIFYYIFYFSNIYVSQKAAALLRFQAQGTASAV